MSNRNLTEQQIRDAQHVPPPTPIVICVRDPDYDNHYEMFGGVEIYDIDLGRMDLRDKFELADWTASHLEDADELREKNKEAGDFYIEQIVTTARRGLDVPDDIEFGEAELRKWLDEGTDEEEGDTPE